jgi:hypothetical protein
VVLSVGDVRRGGNLGILNRAPSSSDAPARD